MQESLKKPLILLAVFGAGWIGVKFLLPVLLPFVMGALIALAAEPLVALLSRRVKLPRSVSTGLGVTVALCFLLALMSVFGAVAVKELGSLAGAVPELADSAREGIVMMQDYLVNLAEKAPEKMRSALTRTVLEFFDDGSAVLTQVTGQIPHVLGAVISWVPDGVRGVGMALISGYMISARLPDLRSGWRQKIPKPLQRYLPVLGKMRRAATGWLVAQGKLAALTYAIVCVGFLLLKIPYGPAWALLVALVDAVPLLGTGTVLVPWALVLLLQKQQATALGMLLLYAVAAVTRTVLEPKLVGRHLGLDPLVTLLILYLGYRFWGIWGMIFAPMLATAAKSAAE